MYASTTRKVFGSRRKLSKTRDPSRTELSVNPFCVTRSNPTHQLTEPTQPHGSTQPVNNSDLAGSLVTSSRPLGRPQKRPDDRTSNAGVAVRTADGSRRTADAGDEQCLRCGCSSPSCTVVFCAANIDGPLLTACTALSTCTPSCRSALQCDHFHKSTSECQRSYSTSSPVSTGMGDRLQAGKPPRNVNAGRLVSGQVYRGKRKASVLCLSVCLPVCSTSVCPV